MKTRHWLPAVCLVLAAAATSAADHTLRVGRLGEPCTLVIEGAKTFSPEEIREAVFDEFDVVTADQENDPLRALTGVIAAKIVAGYKFAGFPDAKVAVSTDGDQLTLSIDEGERYREGEVRVRGTQIIDADQIRDDLTAPEGKGKPRPVWGGEEPASFNSEYGDWLSAKVADLAGDQGFYRPTFNIAVTADKETKKGTLNIDFSDDGARATLNDVVIEGNSASSCEALLAHLALDLQTPLTRDVRHQIEKRLLRSGRFLQVRWELGEAASRDDTWHPRLTLQEYDRAPPLGVPITREEEVLLKLAEWVERFDESDEEVLIRFPGEKASVIFAPRHGFIIEAASPPDGQALPEGGFSAAMVMAEERVGLYSAAQRRKIEAAPPPAPIVGNAEITLVNGGKSLDGRGAMVAGVGMRATTSKALRRHVQMKLKLTAVAALSVIRSHEAKTTWDGEAVCFEWKHRRMRVNALTGQLIEQVVYAPPDGDDDADRDDLSFPHIKVESGKFERRLAEIEKLSADWPNAADGRRPLSCLGEFICRELQAFDPKSKSGYAAVSKLIEQGLLQPFDELVARMGHLEPNAFRIPQPYFHWRFNSVEELIALGPELARAHGIGLGNRLFPQDSWTQAVWRNGVFLLADGRIEASDDLSCQPTDNRGAICALASAEVLRAAGHGPLAALCARRGLRRLSPAAFRNDCRDVLRGQVFLNECLTQIAAALRTLDADEVKAIAAILTRLEVLNERQADIFQQFVLALRNKGRAMPAEAADQALGVFWQAALSDWVKQRLEAIAAPLAEAGPPAPPAFTYGVGPGEDNPYAPWTARPAAGGDYYSTIPAEEQPGLLPPRIGESQAPVDSPEEEKPLKQEIRELKWLAMALTDRLKKLEERVGDDVEQSAVGIPFSVRNGYSLLLRGPDGLKFIPGAPSAPHPLPTAMYIPLGVAVPIELCGVKGHGDEPIYVQIRTAAGRPREFFAIAGAEIPLTFNEPDLNAALAGHDVTQVLYAVRGDGQNKIETLTSPDEEAKLVAKASTRGVVLATVSISKNAGVEPPVIPRVTEPEESVSVALDGHCPVALVESRKWQRGKEDFSAVHHGKTYLFADKESLEAFLKNPGRYVPARDGNDPVLAVDKGVTFAGRREHGAFYEGRVYLFSSEETLQTFDASPDRYVENSPRSADETTPSETEGGIQRIAAPDDRDGATHRR